MRKEQGVAICWRIGDAACPDGAARAGLVLDDHRLSERAFQLLADEPRENIRRAARRERHDSVLVAG